VVELKDEWQTFSIRFSVFCPNIEDDSIETVRIIGSIPEITKNGDINSGPLIMKRAKKKFRWLYDKYG
jgi:hypothetical protein